MGKEKGYRDVGDLFYFVVYPVAVVILLCGGGYTNVNLVFSLICACFFILLILKKA